MKHYSILLLFLFLVSCSRPQLDPQLQTDQIPAEPKVFMLADSNAKFTWEYVQNAGDSAILGFKLMLGLAPNTYSNTIDIADPAARTYVVTGLDTTKKNYARLISYSDWAVSAPTPEITFGGSVSSPLFLIVHPASP